MAGSLGESAPMFPDITMRHPDDPDTELLWHCGLFPYTVCDCSSSCVVTSESHHVDDSAGYVNFRCRPGDVTLVRFDGIGGDYRILSAQGHSSEGPFTGGTYLWTKFENWPLVEYTLANGPYCHHAALVYGHLSAGIMEAEKYILGLHADLVSPSRDRVLASLIDD